MIDVRGLTKQYGDVRAVDDGAAALFLIFGEGPDDDMTTASARAILAAWAVAAMVDAMVDGGLRLLRTDADK